MKPTAKYLPAVALTAVAVAAASYAGPDSASSQGQPTTLELKLPRSAPDALADRGKKGPTTGDEVYITDAITDQSRRKVGAMEAQIAAFSKTLSRAQMLGTISLRGRGSLTLQGRLNLAARRNQGTLAIVGGTGEFAGAAGTARVTTGRSEVVSFTLTFARSGS